MAPDLIVLLQDLKLEQYRGFLESGCVDDCKTLLTLSIDALVGFGVQSDHAHKLIAEANRRHFEQTLKDNLRRLWWRRVTVAFVLIVSLYFFLSSSSDSLHPSLYLASILRINVPQMHAGAISGKREQLSRTVIVINSTMILENNASQTAESSFFADPTESELSQTHAPILTASAQGDPDRAIIDIPSIWHPIRTSQLKFACEKKFPNLTHTTLPARPRTLVIVIAGIRSGFITWPSFFKYVLGGGARDDVDLALALGSYTDGSDHEFRQRAKYIWEVPDPADGNSTSLHRRGKCMQGTHRSYL